MRVGRDMIFGFKYNKAFHSKMFLYKMPILSMFSPTSFKYFQSRESGGKNHAILKVFAITFTEKVNGSAAAC